MQARYYDPVIGRFLSIDPVTFMDTGDPGYFNRYAYVQNDPINAIDPTGMSKKSVLKEAARQVRDLRNARARARRGALKVERKQLQETGTSNSRLSSGRSQELLETGKLKNMDAHHDPSINNGKTHQERVSIAEDPSNVTFKEPADHRKIHSDAGGTQVPINSKGGDIIGVALGAVALGLEGLAMVPDPVSIMTSGELAPANNSGMIPPATHEELMRDVK